MSTPDYPRVCARCAGAVKPWRFQPLDGSQVRILLACELCKRSPENRAFAPRMWWTDNEIESMPLHDPRPQGATSQVGLFGGGRS